MRGQVKSLPERSHPGTLGHEMIVWGGHYAQTLFNSGGRYTPDNDGRQAMTLNGAARGPSRRCRSGSRQWSRAGKL